MGGKKEVLKLTLFSHLCGRLSDTSMLTDKGEHHCPIYLHSQQTDCSSECVWTGKAKRRSRLFSCKWIQCLLCAGWMRECSLCVKALYMPDCQTPCIEIDGLSNDHHCQMSPFASLFLVVMDIVFNSEGCHDLWAKACWIFGDFGFLPPTKNIHLTFLLRRHFVVLKCVCINVIFFLLVHAGELYFALSVMKMDSWNVEFHTVWNFFFFSLDFGFLPRDALNLYWLWHAKYLPWIT